MNLYIETLNGVKDPTHIKTLQNYIDAMRFGNCLLLLGEEQIALDFLKELVYLRRSEKSDDHWVWNALGMAMIFEIERSMGKNRIELTDVLQDDSWLPYDDVAYASKVLENHSGVMTRREDLLLRYKESYIAACEEFSDEVLQLRYFSVYFFSVRRPSIWVRFRLRGLRSAIDESSNVLRDTN